MFLEIGVVFQATLLFTLLGFAQGLKCWECSAESKESCSQTGKLVTCKSTQDVCATVVRRNFFIQKIWKQCKQRQACFNDRDQNLDKYGRRHQCNENMFSSVCCCCCDKDSCNVGKSCSASKVSTPCSPLKGNLRNGRVTCTNANWIGSQCHYSCTAFGYYLNPSDSTTLQCMGNGQWSKKEPCCAKPCPPYAPFDLIALVNRKTDENSGKARGTFGKVMFRRWKLDPEHYREARIVFGDVVYPDFSTFFDDFESSRPEPPRHSAEGEVLHSDLVNTGSALRYIRDHVYVKGHRNPYHKDVMIAFVDKNADDDVKNPAQALRDDGVLTYAVFFKFNNSVSVNKEQLLDIAGEPDHAFIVDGDFEEVAKRVANELIGHLCQDVCGP